MLTAIENNAEIDQKQWKVRYVPKKGVLFRECSVEKKQKCYGKCAAEESKSIVNVKDVIDKCVNDYGSENSYTEMNSSAENEARKAIDKIASRIVTRIKTERSGVLLSDLTCFHLCSAIFKL